MLKITSLEELKKVGEGCIVELPNFPDGTPLVVKIKYPSLLSMMRSDGTIPNPLLKTVTEMNPEANLAAGEETKTPPLTAEQLESSKEMLTALCKECLITPTYGEIEELAGGMTDIQKIALYQKVQGSFAGLSSFRTT